MVYWAIWIFFLFIIQKRIAKSQTWKHFGCFFLRLLKTLCIYFERKTKKKLYNIEFNSFICAGYAALYRFCCWAYTRIMFTIFKWGWDEFHGLRFEGESISRRFLWATNRLNLNLAPFRNLGLNFKIPCRDRFHVISYSNFGSEILWTVKHCPCNLLMLPAYMIYDYDGTDKDD